MLEKAKECQRKEAQEVSRRLEKAKEGLRNVKNVEGERIPKRFKIYNCFLIDS